MKFYEPGMRILFDPGKREVTVTFRGRRTTLPSQYETDDQARQAGENYCRSQGWKDYGTTAPMAPKSLLAHRKGARPFF